MSQLLYAGGAWVALALCGLWGVLSIGAALMFVRIFRANNARSERSSQAQESPVTTHPSKADSWRRP